MEAVSGREVPAELMPVFDGAITVDYTSVTGSGNPITVPLTPYLDVDARTLDVSTGLTYAAKAERARRNPKVSLLYSDPLGSSAVNPPVVLVQGYATVCDRDLQSNTDRYVRESMAKLPAGYKGQPRFVLRTLDWYFARIWIKVTPTRVTWWPSRALDETPFVWEAPADRVAPPSDPPPDGKNPNAWLPQPADWRASAGSVGTRLDMQELSWVGADGFPMCIPVRATPIDSGFRLTFGAMAPPVPDGPACLVAHTHSPAFETQENRTFIGTITRDGDIVKLDVERVLADISLAGNKLKRTIDFLAKGRRLKPRLKSEAARRGQAVPKVRLP
ncbi:MAG: hypothetical protein LLG14_07045 [Nocardiaceae bacterium]|nr:hypothetical protein [Nocardiaceae bacterium]